MSAGLVVDEWRVEPLSPLTWEAFAALAERHNGVFGGCWCTWFHLQPGLPERSGSAPRIQKAARRAGSCPCGLGLRRRRAVAWAEFGTVAELPNIHHRKQWEAEAERRPDYRITCLFVEGGYRRKGMAAVAVRGALALIAAAGGGLVESYPHDLPPGKKTSSSFLYNATRTMYERSGSATCGPRVRATA